MRKISHRRRHHNCACLLGDELLRRALDIAETSLAHAAIQAAYACSSIHRAAVQDFIGGLAIEQAAGRTRVTVSAIREATVRLRFRMAAIAQEGAR